MSQWPRSVSVIFFSLSTIGFFFPAVNAEEPKPYELEEVVVSSTRLPSEKVSIYDLPNKITVITADQIRKSGFKTVQEAVQYETGVVLYDQNGNPFQSTVNLRGFSGQPVNATSVFVDGVRVNECKPFDDAQRLAREVSARVQPRLPVEVGRLDDQRVPIPAAA